MTDNNYEKIEFITKRNVPLVYGIKIILFEDSQIITFIDKYDNEVTLNKQYVSRRWQE